MSEQPSELPIFPTNAPALISDAADLPGLFEEVLTQLASLVEVDDDQLQASTPCVGFTVGELRSHVVGWLQFFAAALRDPAGGLPRSDPSEYELAEGESARRLVDQALVDINQAIADDAATKMIVMSSSRMAGDGVLAMALGEYITHSWDLAVATGQTFSAPEAAVIGAHEFLEGMVTPQFRGPDSGFFGDEVEVAHDAPALDRLLGFSGRAPDWTPG